MSLVAGSALLAGLAYTHYQARNEPALQLAFAGAGTVAPRLQLAGIQLLQSCACSVCEASMAESLGPAFKEPQEPSPSLLAPRPVSIAIPVEDSALTAAEWIATWKERMALFDQDQMVADDDVEGAQQIVEPEAEKILSAAPVAATQHIPTPNIEVRPAQQLSQIFILERCSQSLAGTSGIDFS